MRFDKFIAVTGPGRLRRVQAQDQSNPLKTRLYLNRYCPVQWGVRFSRKAEIPSCASRERAFRVITSWA